MKKTLTLRLTNILGLSTILLTLLLTLSSTKASAQVTFTGGTPQTLSVCQDAIATSVNSLLEINDPASGLTETWTVTTSPSHGSLSLSSFVATSTGGTISPTGWTYTPTGGYSGSDVFVIQVDNGTVTTTTTINVTVNPLPAVAAITGTLSECIGATTTLSNATAGGTWFSSDPSIATISTSGVVTGLIAGSNTILYSVTDGGTGCTNFAFATNTVLTVPSVSSISGSSTVCLGSSTAYSDATAGGSWSTSNAAVASVSSGGTVFGISAGSATITYSVTNSCGTGRATQTVTVETSTVAAIAPSGAVSVCVGATTTLTNATSGGAWGTTDASIASVNPASGVVTGVSTGSATIIYSVTNSCGTNSQTKSVTVNTIPTAPPAISGITTACVGLNTTLSNSTSGGTWSSGNSAIATVNPSTGVVTGVSSGTTNITYTVFNSCGSNFITTSFTVNTVPSTPTSITGPTSLCVGSTTTLSNSSGGGLWSSTNTSVATVDATTGVVTGLAIGTTVISYTRTNSCGSSAAFINDTVTNVPTAPAAISGPTAVCVGSTISLTDATAGGSWSSTSPSNASVTTTGIVRGVAAGSTVISYTVTNFCGTSAATSTIIVNDVPAAPATPSGVSTLCVGSTSTFTDATTGGVWSSSNTSLATISSGGVVTALATGTVSISYTVTNSCGSTTSAASLTLNTVPTLSAIGGTLSICTGSTTTLTNTATGGTWLSGTPSIATIDPSTGVATSGSSAGSTIITYSVTNGCGTTDRTATLNVTAPPATPGTIFGSNEVCTGSTTTLSNATSGGTWTSSNTSVASVGSSSGIVTGVTVGSATITYTVSNFCGAAFNTLAMSVLTVPAPAAITGSNTVCVANSITLADATAGGTWSSSNSSIATVNSASGVVTGVATGSANITYTVTNICGTGTRIKTIAVGDVPATPPAIGGPASVCVGAVVFETNSTTGGTWSTSNAAVVSISATTATTFGVSAGTATITYTVSNACGSSFVTRAFTVNTVPAMGAISGTSPMCAGTTATFTDTTAGGTWTTANVVIASVNSASGLVTAMSVGTTNISYTKSNTCGASSVTFPVTVTIVPSTPAAITGPSAVCVGASISLASSTTGGTWSSANPAAITVDASSGVATGVSVGGVNISYTVSNSCGTSAPRLKFITINGLPSVGAITGTTTVCAGGTSSLGNSTGGGVWSSSNTSVASINSSTGLVNAVSAGTATISYTVTNGCGPTTVTRTFTVTTVPATPPAITGTTSVCVSATTTLSDSVTGGAWSTSNVAVASVNPSTGVVFGVSGGTANITYTVTNSCGSTAINTAVTVNTVPASPAAITGATSVCAGSTTTFSDATAGGVWSSSLPGVATINASTGEITGITAGSAAIISYTVSNGCGPTSVTKSISVITVPSVAAISGSTTVCTGSSTTLTDATTGGTWSTSDASIASVHPTTGNVTGVSGTPAGLTAVISYAVTNSCGTTSATRTVTVITTPSAPAAISGTTTFCLGSSTTLTDATSGGVWSSTNTGVATISTSGVVFGSSVGTSTISYTVTNACGPTATTTTVNVITVPSVSAITGPSIECVGSSITMSSSPAGGTWTSSVPSVATVSTTGVVTGASVGTTVIIYSVTNICGTNIATKNDTVINGTVTAITGATNLCRGASTTLTNATTGGTWSSSNFTVATVNPATGSVTGVTAGSVNITYSVTTVCGTNSSVHAMTIDSAGVAAITGTTTVCEASTTTLSNATPSGVWNSLSTATATVNPTTGVVTGVAAGTVTIGYTVSNSCGTFPTFTSVTVNPLPVAGTISGPTAVCEGSAITLTDAAAGGTWSTTDASVASVNTTGSVTGISAGTATISYTVTNSCGTLAATSTITVNPLPHAGTISGATDVCEASTITLSSSVTGGNWSSSASGTATVDASGNVTGVAAGTATISYAVTNICGTDVATHSVTVNPLPIVASITGATSVCEASTTTLSSTTSGGTWSSTAITIASIDASTGLVYGVSAGAATISYTVVNAFSCSTTVAAGITVNPLPISGTISGPTIVCEGSSISLSTTSSGGSWSTSATGNANVGGSGIVNGITAGADTIYYTVTNSCGTSVSSYPITINPLPHAGTLTGTVSTICQNDTVRISSTVTGGTWSSSSSSVATVDGTGLVYGASAGSATISYNVTNSCGTDFVTFTITVSPLPNAGSISGSSTVCEAGTTTLTNSVSGGTWITVNGNASVGSTTGVVSGVAPGADTVYYIVTSTCGADTAMFPITILPLPHVGSILGPSVVCVSSIITLTDTAAGGTWSSSLPGIASVQSPGVILGVSSGLATISYVVTNSCGTVFATRNVTVNPLPVAGTITGTNVVCVGAITTLSSSITGGIYTSSDTAIAKVIPSTSDVRGVSAGTAIISYEITNSCGTAYDTMMVRVNPLPNAGSITGTPVVCVGANTTLSSTTTGGTWVSTNTAIASVNSTTGVVHGIVAGVDTIKYFVTNSCGTDSTFVTLTVNPLPDAGVITGPTAVCVADSITLTDTSGGSAGTWTVNPSGIALVGAGTGVIIGVSSGTAHVTYSVTNSCGTDTVQHAITVNPLPNAGTISGLSVVCVSATITLTNSGSVGAGTWSATNGNATVGSISGIVTGVTAGIDTIVYTATTATCGSATTTRVITINPLPVAGTIYGASTVCVGNATVLGDTTGSVSGTWTSSNTLIASIDAGGTVFGISAGTATITYAVTTSCGTARTTHTITVIGVPSAGTITGSSIVCEGSTAAFSVSATGGRWSSSVPAVATVDTASGLVSGVSAGTATISYTVSNSCATVSSTIGITVTPLAAPGVITPGSYSLCQGDSTLLVDTATGGTWSSASTGIANVSSVGMVRGVGAGTALISYCKTNSCGTVCATASITVNPLANAGTITGPATVCEAATTGTTPGVGVTTTGSAGGAWNSSDPTVADVDAFTGDVTGMSAGTATISYVVTTPSCGADTATFTITVLPLPHAGVMSGPSSLCTGASITLTDTLPGGATATGGTWSSSSAAASVDGFGNVTGVSAGTSIISYTVTNSCGTDVASHTVTVNPTPSAGTISGPTHLCPGSSINLTSSGTAGGTWTSSFPAIANFISTPGRLTGITTGVVNVTYTVTSASCGTYTATYLDTVNPAPDAGTISGSSTVCAGTTTALTSSGATGGTWTSSAVATASVDPTGGIVYGRVSGTATITYSYTNSCGTDTATWSITVLAAPSAGTLGGPSSVCEGSSTAPSPITVTGAVGTGSWTSSDYSIASVDGSGFVYGVSPGTATITYTSTNSCGTVFTTRSFTVNPLPVPGSISGPSNVCMGLTITLSPTVGGGTWSGGSGRASVGATTGIVTGTSAGTAIISYGVTNSCGTRYATYSVTVDPLPVAGSITGTTNVCLGSTISVGVSASHVGTGAWTTATTTYLSLTATSDTTANVTGVAVGAQTITYTASTVCGSSYTVATINVRALPSAGTLSGYTGPFCAGTSITMSSTVTGGTWTATPTAVAGIGATSGVLTGAGGGTATVSYTVTSPFCGSDVATTTVTVNPLPYASSPYTPATSSATDTNVCVGTTRTIRSNTYGGTTSGIWTSSNPAIASVSMITTGSGSDATLYAVSAGTVSISYAATNGCGTVYGVRTFIIHPNPTAGTITGGISIACVGTTYSASPFTISGSTGGTGSWSSSAGGTITSGGVFTAGSAAASVLITYTTTSAYCGTVFDTALVTVLTAPLASIITGTDTICEGSTTLLSDSVAGGTWSSSNPTIASITPSGTVIAVGSGTVIIYYTLSNPCGTDIRSFPMLINPLPHAGTITGSSSLCVGTPVTLSASVAGGTWYASNSIATVSATGTVLGSSLAGNDTIYYVVNNSCGSDTSLKVVTVNLLPDAGLITAAQNFICGGDSITLNNAAGGGFWTSSNAAVAPVASITTAGPSSAKVYGLSAGTTIIAYNFVNYCGTATDTILITVRPAGHCYDAVEQEIKPTEQVTIYPNPAVSVLHIDATVTVNVSVISPDGKVVIEQKATKDIDVSNLASGLYMIMIYDENNALLKASKFIKQ